MSGAGIHILAGVFSGALPCRSRPGIFATGVPSLILSLLAIYIIVAVVRNYVEPKIMGTQLGLHPIITLVSMFIVLRLLGFWDLFGLPVSISFFWKQKKDKESVEGSICR